MNNAARRQAWRWWPALVVCATGLLILPACSLFRASPARDTGYIPNPQILTENRDRAPFNGYWITESFKAVGDRRRYSGIYIRPVETMVVEDQIDSRPYQESFKLRRKEEAREVARYMKEKFTSALRDYPGEPLTVIEDPQPGCLVLQIAVVELVPTNPVINAVGTAAGFFVPGTEILKVFSTGSVAVEVFLRELDTNAAVMAWKDRQIDQRAPFSVKDYQEYAHIRGAIDAWAEETAELLATPPSHKVEARALFTLLPF